MQFRGHLLYFTQHFDAALALSSIPFRAGVYQHNIRYMEKNITILAIETSCDETAAAVVRDDGFVLSSIVASQIPLFASLGGVVPEMAARAHTEKIILVIEEALKAADTDWTSISEIAATQGPGLVGSLLVGRCTAEAIALAKQKPLRRVDHLRAHTLAAELWDESFHVETGPKIGFPAIALLVSGGHTEIIWMVDREHWEVVGSTIDDAAGEAFDKVGKLLGLPYPGGPNVSKAALLGDSMKFAFPRAMMEKGSLNFSFSGLKTAVLREVRSYNEFHAGEGVESRSQFVNNVAASFQKAVVDVLVRKTALAVEQFSRGKFEVQSVILAGGVAANSVLRESMRETFGVRFLVPSLRYCTDNAAMVGMSAERVGIRGTYV